MDTLVWYGLAMMAPILCYWLAFVVRWAVKHPKEMGVALINAAILFIFTSGLVGLVFFIVGMVRSL